MNIIAPSHLYPSIIVDINMAGVVAIPQSTTSTPISVKASTQACLKSGPVNLESVPIEIFIWSFLSLSIIHVAKPRTKFLTSSLVRVISRSDLSSL